MKTVLLTTILVFAAGVTLAQPGPGQGMRMRLLDDLNLTDAQKTQIEKIHTEAMQQGIDRRAEIAKARVDLGQMLKADKPDQSAIEKKMDAIAGMRSDGEKHRLQTWFTINKQLNTEQQKVWKQGLERRKTMGRTDRRGRMYRDGRGRDFDGQRGFRDRGPR